MSESIDTYVLELERELSEKKEENARLQSELDHEREVLSTTSTEKKALEVDLIKETAEAKNLRDLLSQERNQADKHRDEISQLKKEVSNADKMRISLETLQDALQEMTSENENLAGELISAKSVIESWQPKKPNIILVLSLGARVAAILLIDVLMVLNIESSDTYYSVLAPTAAATILSASLFWNFKMRARDFLIFSLIALMPAIICLLILR
ncbi:MAG: hypothetical protein LBU32_08660 [Clostridiales bacterium]|jgi:predicted RNase H-like nuclease (RuvC/YqgF family)|nr:hypothetical protein [Clostridiales bacterium]